MTGDLFVQTQAGVASNASMTVTGASSGRGAVEIHTVATTGAADVFEERDTTGDGTYDVSLLVETSGSAIHSQKNKIEVSDALNQRLRIENTSDSAIDIQVTGVEVYG